MSLLVCDEKLWIIVSCPSSLCCSWFYGPLSYHISWLGIHPSISLCSFPLHGNYFLLPLGFPFPSGSSTSILGWEDKTMHVQDRSASWIGTGVGSLFILFIPNESKSVWASTLAQCSSVWRKSWGSRSKAYWERGASLWKWCCHLEAFP